MKMEGQSEPRAGSVFSRRDFLTFGTGAIAAVGLESRMRKTREEESVGMEVRFSFGNDYLSPRDITAADRLILGETWVSTDLVIWKSDSDRIAKDFVRYDTLELFFRSFGRYTVSASGIAQREHIEALGKAKLQGSQLVITDDWHSRTIPFYKQQEYADLQGDAQERSLTGVLLGSMGLITAYLHSTREDRTVQTLAKDSLKATARMIPITGAIALFGYFLSRRVASTVGQSKLAPLYADSINQFMELVGSLGDEDKRQVFQLTDVRDASMALNTLVVEESLRQMPELATALKQNDPTLGLLFYAGTAHATAKPYYEQGLHSVSEILARHARDTISFIQKKYHEASGFEQKEAALEDWILLTGPYNYPIPTYALHREYLQGHERSLPYTPRAILWQEVLVAALDDPDDQALHRMGERLLLEDFGFQYLMYDLHDGYEGVEFSERQAMMDRAKIVGLRDHNFPVVRLFKIRDADPSWQLVISEGVPFLFRIEE